MDPQRVILDTNVFVAAGFNPRSRSAQILERIRSGEIRMIWDPSTRRETERIIRKIPPLSWRAVADLFREEELHLGPTALEDFDFVPDPDDRKYAALAQATGAILITNDSHLLNCRCQCAIQIVTPSEFGV